MYAEIRVNPQGEIYVIIWESGGFSRQVKDHFVYDGDLASCKAWCEENKYSIGSVKDEREHD